MTSSKTQRGLTISIMVLTMLLVYIIAHRLQERVVTVGEAAPDFSITSDNGRIISASSFGGKLLVLNFWATWCPPCVAETPSLSRFAAEYARKGVVVLGVSVDKDAKAYNAFLQRFRPAFLTARDTQIHAEYGTFMYPETYIIDTQGKVLKKIAEPIDWTNPEITRYIDSLL